MSNENDPQRTVDREAALAMVPRLLVALAGACTLSGAVGFGMALAGEGPPPLAVLLAPPVAVLLLCPWYFTRRMGTPRDE